MNKSMDNIRLGFILGITIPILSILLIYVFYFRTELDILEFFKILFVHRIHAKVVAVAVYFGNLLSFFLFLKIDKLKTVKGIVMATVIYSMLVLILNLFMEV